MCSPVHLPRIARIRRRLGREIRATWAEGYAGQAAIPPHGRARVSARRRLDERRSMSLPKTLQQPFHELLLVEIGEIFELLSGTDKSR